MYRRAHCSAVSLLPTLGLLAQAASCGGSVTRVVVVPGFQPDEISMTPDEGALIDEFLAGEPKTGRCEYWKSKLNEVPAGRTGASTYVEKKGGGVCASRETSKDRPVARPSAAPAAPGRGADAGGDDPLKDPPALKQACLAGDTSKCFNGGLAYANGHGVPVDVTTAADLYRRACDAGHSGGCSNLAYFYMNGTGVGQSWDQALALFTKGCGFTSHRLAQRACADQKVLTERKTLADAEIKAGRCNADRAARAQAGILGLSRQFDAMSTGSEMLKTEDTKIIVATESGVSVPVTAGLGGEYHLFAVSGDPVRLSVKDGSGYDVRTASEYQIIVQNAGPTDSRVLQATAGQSIPVTVSGHGCTIFMVVRKF